MNARPDPTRDDDDPAHAVGWWMREETAWCSFCWQGYAWELQVSCVRCDRSTCPLCVDHDHADGPCCPECGRQEAHEEVPA